MGFVIIVQMEAVRSMTNKRGLPLIHTNKHFCWRYIFSMPVDSPLVYCNNQLSPAWRETRKKGSSTLSK